MPWWIRCEVLCLILEPETPGDGGGRGAKEGMIEDQSGSYRITDSGPPLSQPVRRGIAKCIRTPRSPGGKSCSRRPSLDSHKAARSSTGLPTPNITDTAARCPRRLPRDRGAIQE